MSIVRQLDKILERQAREKREIELLADSEADVNVTLAPVISTELAPPSPAGLKSITREETGLGSVNFMP